MPCRALEAFRLLQNVWAGARGERLNALSGIGGVQTQQLASGSPDRSGVLMPCRALEAFRRATGTRTGPGMLLRLNALSGIGGVQTKVYVLRSALARRNKS